ncbi:hypothetical protein [Streptomonospora salina]|uniref:Uncharacterized protein n=1 Tax=Streptomonospora salina TaxID=104205 RepID=A0A841EKD2_9ACTN|nr:hypothetical protein [Streptomonospora salina]MBB6001238.1 hypothetical protein [Streptomonospora salina]
MRNFSRPNPGQMPDARRHETGARPRRARRPRGARPYLAMQPAPEPPVLPVSDDGTAELCSAVRRLLAARPDLAQSAHSARTTAGVHR